MLHKTNWQGPSCCLCFDSGYKESDVGWVDVMGCLLVVGMQYLFRVKGKRTLDLAGLTLFYDSVALR